MQAVAVPGAVTDPQTCRRPVEVALEAFGRIDILVNSVHVSLPGEEEEVWRRGLEVLLLVPVRLTDLVVSHMKEQGRGDRTLGRYVPALARAGPAGVAPLPDGGRPAQLGRPP